MGPSVPVTAIVSVVSGVSAIAAASANVNKAVNNNKRLRDIDLVFLC
jgi:hypothetical protein